MPIDLDSRPEHPFRLQSITREAIRRALEHDVRDHLPSKTDGEVEIARIRLKTTTADMGCVWVRQSGRGLVYRFVDEYGGQALNRPAHVRVSRPLTLGNLARFVARVWGLREALEYNYGDEFAGRLDFFRATSEDYPALDAALCSLVEDWFDQDHATGDEEQD